MTPDDGFLALNRVPKGKVWIPRGQAKSAFKGKATGSMHPADPSD